MDTIPNASQTPFCLSLQRHLLQTYGNIEDNNSLETTKQEDIRIQYNVMLGNDGVRSKREDEVLISFIILHPFYALYCE